MQEYILELPYIAIIPYHVQCDTSISDAAKLYFGQIVQLAKKTGYMWATDKQLAEMKGVSVRSIERWNNELDKAGHIRRVTANYPKKNSDGSFEWIKKRKVYFNDAFAIPKPNPIKPEIPGEMDENTDSIGSAENGLSLGTAENGLSLGSAENGGINKESLDEIYKLQCDVPSPSVVVFSSLLKLTLCPKLAVKISNEYSQHEVDIAVERCLKWKNRTNDEVGIMTTLTRAESWCDAPSEDERISSNLKFLHSLKILDGMTISKNIITIGHKYIEFIAGMKVTIFDIDDLEFKKKTNDFLDYLNLMDESKDKK